jgi:hypothetical protein
MYEKDIIDMIGDGEIIYRLVKYLGIDRCLTHSIHAYGNCIDFEGDDDFKLFKRIMKRKGYWKYLNCKVDNRLKWGNEKEDIHVIYLSDEGKKNKNDIITLLRLNGYDFNWI